MVVDKIMIETTFGHLLRRERVFHVARAALRPDHFSQLGEAAYRHVWGAAMEYYDEYHRLAGAELLAAEVMPRMRTDISLTQADYEDAIKLINFVWSDRFATEGDFNDDAALRWIQCILIDRDINRELTRKVQDAHGAGTAIENLPGVLADLSERYQAIQGLQGSHASVVVPDSWATERRALVPTGIPLFDVRMSGGNEPGDVNVLLGPTGVGKTMAGMQIATSTARLAHHNVENHGQEPKVSVFVSYEDDIRAMRVRGICVGAEIHKERLERMEDYSGLSTQHNLQDYERERWAAALRQRQPVNGERERLELASRWMNRYLRFLDFSGSRSSRPPRGNGGIAEIRTALEQVRQETGMQIGTVIIDWAGTAVRKHLRAQGKDPDRLLSIELTDYVDRVHSQITAPFDCVGWVLHQLKGQANNRPPTARLHHSDAEWCSSFAVNAWFAFILGNKDERTNTCLFSCTKTRRGEGMSSIVCRIDGAFGRLVEAGNEFRVDPTSRQIISRRDHDAVQAAAAMQARPSATRLTPAQRPRDYDDPGGGV